jgi:RimJ/RimL family protein N-acetyltransferase
MRWLQGRGVQRVVSEIYAGNAASQIAAEAAGMAHVGDMFHYRTGNP